MTAGVENPVEAAGPEEREYALHRAIDGLRDDHPMQSASQPIMGWQRGALWTLLVLVVILSIWQPMTTAVVMVGICTFGYVLTMLDRVLIFKEGLASRPIVVTDEQARAIADADLPRYTILVPAYDEVTIEAAGDCANADVITIVLVPPAEPRTKPKACNYGLHFATGDIVTIYDAEDVPEPLQLRRGAAAFRELPDDVACIQAKLAYHNGSQNLLTGWFTAEYGLWFGYLLPGMMSSSTPIPLGIRPSTASPPSRSTRSAPGIRSTSPRTPTWVCASTPRGTTPR